MFKIKKLIILLSFFVFTHINSTQIRENIEELNTLLTNPTNNETKVNNLNETIHRDLINIIKKSIAQQQAQQPEQQPAQQPEQQPEQQPAQQQAQQQPAQQPSQQQKKLQLILDNKKSFDSKIFEKIKNQPTILDSINIETIEEHIKQNTKFKSYLYTKPTKFNKEATEKILELINNEINNYDKDLVKQASKLADINQNVDIKNIKKKTEEISRKKQELNKKLKIFENKKYILDGRPGYKRELFKNFIISSTFVVGGLLAKTNLIKEWGQFFLNWVTWIADKIDLKISVPEKLANWISYLDLTNTPLSTFMKYMGYYHYFWIVCAVFSIFFKIDVTSLSIANLLNLIGYKAPLSIAKKTVNFVTENKKAIAITIGIIIICIILDQLLLNGFVRGQVINLICFSFKVTKVALTTLINKIKKIYKSWFATKEDAKNAINNANDDINNTILGKETKDRYNQELTDAENFYKIDKYVDAYNKAINISEKIKGNLDSINEAVNKMNEIYKEWDKDTNDIDDIIKKLDDNNDKKPFKNLITNITNLRIYKKIDDSNTIDNANTNAEKILSFLQENNFKNMLNDFKNKIWETITEQNDKNEYSYISNSEDSIITKYKNYLDLSTKINTQIEKIKAKQESANEKIQDAKSKMTKLYKDWQKKDLSSIMSKISQQKLINDTLKNRFGIMLNNTNENINSLKEAIKSYDDKQYQDAAKKADNVLEFYSSLYSSFEEVLNELKNKVNSNIKNINSILETLRQKNDNFTQIKTEVEAIDNSTDSIIEKLDKYIDKLPTLNKIINELYKNIETNTKEAKNEMNKIYKEWDKDTNDIDDIIKKLDDDNNKKPFENLKINIEKLRNIEILTNIEKLTNLSEVLTFLKETNFKNMLDTLKNEISKKITTAKETVKEALEEKIFMQENSSNFNEILENIDNRFNLINNQNDFSIIEKYKKHLDLLNNLNTKINTINNAVTKTTNTKTEAFEKLWEATGKMQKIYSDWDKEDAENYITEVNNKYNSIKKTEGLWNWITNLVSKSRNWLKLDLFSNLKNAIKKLKEMINMNDKGQYESVTSTTFPDLNFETMLKDLRIIIENKISEANKTLDEIKKIDPNYKQKKDIPGISNINDSILKKLDQYCDILEALYIAITQLNNDKKKYLSEQTEATNSIEQATDAMNKIYKEWQKDTDEKIKSTINDITNKKYDVNDNTLLNNLNYNINYLKEAIEDNNNKKYTDAKDKANAVNGFLEAANFNKMLQNLKNEVNSKITDANTVLNKIKIPEDATGDLKATFDSLKTTFGDLKTTFDELEKTSNEINNSSDSIIKQYKEYLDLLNDVKQKITSLDSAMKPLAKNRIKEAETEMQKIYSEWENENAAVYIDDVKSKYTDLENKTWSGMLFNWINSTKKWFQNDPFEKLKNNISSLKNAKTSYNKNEYATAIQTAQTVINNLTNLNFNTTLTNLNNKINERINQANTYLSHIRDIDSNYQPKTTVPTINLSSLSDLSEIEKLNKCYDILDQLYNASIEYSSTLAEMRIKKAETEMKKIYSNWDKSDAAKYIDEVKNKYTDLQNQTWSGMFTNLINSAKKWFQNDPFEKLKNNISSLNKAKTIYSNVNEGINYKTVTYIQAANKAQNVITNLTKLNFDNKLEGLKKAINIKIDNAKKILNNIKTIKGEDYNPGIDIPSIDNISENSSLSILQKLDEYYDVLNDLYEAITNLTTKKDELQSEQTEATNSIEQATYAMNNIYKEWEKDTNDIDNIINKLDDSSNEKTAFQNLKTNINYLKEAIEDNNKKEYTDAKDKANAVNGFLEAANFNKMLQNLKNEVNSKITDANTVLNKIKIPVDATGDLKATFDSLKTTFGDLKTTFDELKKTSNEINNSSDSIIKQYKEYLYLLNDIKPKITSLDSAMETLRNAKNTTIEEKISEAKEKMSNIYSGWENENAGTYINNVKNKLSSRSNSYLSKFKNFLNNKIYRYVNSNATGIKVSQLLDYTQPFDNLITNINSLKNIINNRNHNDQDEILSKIDSVLSFLKESNFSEILNYIDNFINALNNIIAFLTNEKEKLFNAEMRNGKKIDSNIGNIGLNIMSINQTLKSETTNNKSLIEKCEIYLDNFDKILENSQNLLDIIYNLKQLNEQLTKSLKEIEDMIKRLEQYASSEKEQSLMVYGKSFGTNIIIYVLKNAIGLAKDKLDQGLYYSVKQPIEKMWSLIKFIFNKLYKEKNIDDLEKNLNIDENNVLPDEQAKEKLINAGKEIKEDTPSTWSSFFGRTLKPNLSNLKMYSGE